VESSGLIAETTGTGTQIDKPRGIYSDKWMERACLGLLGAVYRCRSLNPGKLDEGMSEGLSPHLSPSFLLPPPPSSSPLLRPPSSFLSPFSILNTRPSNGQPRFLQALGIATPSPKDETSPRRQREEEVAQWDWSW